MGDLETISPDRLEDEQASHGGAPSWTAERSRDLPAGVVFMSTVYGGTGYATEGWAEAVGLAQSQIPMQLVPIGPQDDSRRLLPVPVRNALENLKLRKLDLARSVVYQHTTADGFNLNLYGRCRVGRTMFESDRIPDGWADQCNAMDEVWVPTEFNRQTFAFAGVDEKRLRVLPIGIDSSLFRPGHEPFPWPQARGFRFLSNFDWLDRKGMKVLLKAYLGEFKADEDVCLVLKIAQHGNKMAEAEAQLACFVEREAGLSLENSPPIILVKGSIPHLEMPRLYASADAYVLASHGEGFGLPYIEALACGLPVIATRWSGQLDFLHDENSYLIDVEGLVPASPEVELYAGHRWVQPSVEHLRQLMRRVFSRPEETRERAALGRREILERWDWDAVLKRWTAGFQRLLNQ